MAAVEVVVLDYLMKGFVEVLVTAFGEGWKVRRRVLS
jgi:hypothetical protein